MQEKCRFWVMALVFLSLFVVALPHQARADSLDADCNKLNAEIQTNEDAKRQEKASYLNNLIGQFPIAPVTNACVQNLMKIMSMLPSLADPVGIAAAVIGSMVTSVLQQACSAVMSAVTSVQTALTNITKICLPMPQFSAINISGLSVQSCSGGMTISPLSGYSGSSNMGSLFDAGAAYRKYLSVTGQ